MKFYPQPLEMFNQIKYQSININKYQNNISKKYKKGYNTFKI